MAVPSSPPDADDHGPEPSANEALPKMPSKAGWWIGGILLTIGLIGGTALTGVGIGRAVSLSKTQRLSVPATRTLQLEPGTYQVKVDDSYYNYTINPRVFVTTPSGTEVEVTANSDPFNDPNRSYTSGKKLGYFDAPQAGSYTVRSEQRAEADEPDDESPTTTRRGSTTTTWSGSRYNRTGYPNTVSVARSDDEVAAQSVGFILGGSLGGLLLMVAGGIVLIVTGVRTGKAKSARRPKRPPPYANFPPPAYAGPGGYRPPPPGSYPPPQGYGYGGPRPYAAPPAGPYGVYTPAPGPVSFAGPAPQGPAYPGPPPPGYGPSGTGPSSGPQPPGHGPTDRAIDPVSGIEPPGFERSASHLRPPIPTTAYDEPAFDDPPDDRPHYGDPPFPDPTR